VHDARAQRLEPRAVEAHRGDHAGTEVVDHDVGGRDQPLERPLAGIGSQVEDRRALVAVERREVPREALDDRALGAHRIALGWLDLDDVGAEVGEELRAERAGEDPGQVDDADARELHDST
jgi:hypothetical protein